MNRPVANILQQSTAIEHCCPKTSDANRFGTKLGVVVLYFLIDVVSIVAVFYLVYVARFGREFLLKLPPGVLQPELFSQPHFRDHLEIAGMMGLFLITLLYKNDLYTTPHGKRFFTELSALANAIFLTTIFGITVSFILQRFVISRLVLLAFAAALFPVLGTWRYLRREALKYFNRRGYHPTRALIVGAGKVGIYLHKMLQDEAELGVIVIGFLDDHPERLNPNDVQSTTLGTLRDFGSIVAKHGIQDVYITIPSERAKVMRLVEQAQELGVNVHIVPDLFDLLVREVEFEKVGALTMLRLFRPTLSNWERLVKRVEDLVLAFLLLLVFSPLVVLIAFAIKLDSPGPVIYKQLRHGMHGRLFWLYKFRSMYAGADENKHRQAAKRWVKSSFPVDEQSGVYKLTNDDRITRVGRVIRRFNVDELPQLWNVIRGEMSLIGPRPPLPYEYEEYENHQKKRLTVKPGITGLWQVSGLHRLSFSDMVLLDLRYINEWSIYLELEIFFKTVSLVLFGKGI